MGSSRTIIQERTTITTKTKTNNTIELYTVQNAGLTATAKPVAPVASTTHVLFKPVVDNEGRKVEKEDVPTLDELSWGRVAQSCGVRRAYDH